MGEPIWKSLSIIYIYTFCSLLLTIFFLLGFIYIEESYFEIDKRKLKKKSLISLLFSMIFDFSIIIFGFLFVNKVTTFLLRKLFCIHKGLEKYNKEHFGASSLVIVCILLKAPIQLQYKIKTFLNKLKIKHTYSKNKDYS